MFSEDIGLFFNTGEFAQPATYNGASIVNGLLGKAYVTVNEVETTAPSFTCAASNVPTVKHGDDLLIDGIAYKVVGVKPDGTGIVTLILEEQ